MNLTILKNIFKIFSLKQKTIFLFLIALTSLSSVFEMIGIFLILPISTILFDINEPTKYDSFFNYFLKIQDYFGGDYKIIVILILISVFTLKFIFLFFSNYFQVRFLNYVNADLDKKILLNKLNKDYKIFINYKINNFAQPILRETGFFVQRVLQQLLIIIADLPLVIFFILVLYFENQLVFFIVAGFFLIIILFYLFVVRNLMNTYGKHRYEFERERIDIISQIFNSIRDIKLYTKNKYFYDNFKNIENKYFKTLNVILTLSFLPRLFLEYFFILFVSLILIYILNYSGNLVENIPFFAFLVISGSRLAPILNRLISAFQQIKFFKTSSEEIIKSIKKQNESYPHKKLDDFTFKSNLTLKEVTYKHNKYQKVLFNNLSIKIKKNKITGIVGNSGSGKSTLVNLLCGLLKTDSSKLYFDNKKMNKSNIENLYNKFAIISQNSNLILGSFKENIAFGDIKKNINMKKVVKVSKQVGIHDFINNLPKKYETILSEKISNISGGQKQRIEIARAIYFDREILILDESTNSLDKRNEQIIIDTLKKLSSNKTIIFISHNRNRLDFCDYIYEIKNQKAKLIKI